jgi:hypothetical protein
MRNVEQLVGGRSPLGTLSGKLGYLAATETELVHPHRWCALAV